MEQKIQLRHPAGKKALRMDKGKYDTLKKMILNHLKIKGESTHTEIFHSINEELKKDKINFEGSVEWHLEWVKLDLEAGKEIKRIGDKTPVKFAIVK
jgi:hypothetical protein